jgi:hypothetical protein
VVKGMADLAIKLAKEPRRTAVEAKWSSLFTASR